MQKTWKYLNTVTTVSKIIATVLFVALPFIGFSIGYNYGVEIERNNQILTDEQEVVIPENFTTDEAGHTAIAEVFEEVEHVKITDKDYIKYKAEIDAIVEKTQSSKIQVTITNIGEGGEGSQYIDTYDPIAKTFSSVEKVGTWSLNYDEFYTSIFENGQLVRSEEKTGIEVARINIDFDELKPIDLEALFSNFHPIENSDTDMIYDYKSSSKKISAEKTVYTFVLHNNSYDIDSETKFTINNVSGIVERIDFPDWTGDTAFEIVKL